VVHEHKRLGRGIELAALAEQLKAAGIGLEFLTGELQGSHDPSGIVFTVLAALSGMEREYIRTLEGHESARTRGKTIGGAAVTDDAMLSMVLLLRGQGLSLRDIAERLIITKGKKKASAPHPPPFCAYSATTTNRPPQKRLQAARDQPTVKYLTSLGQTWGSYEDRREIPSQPRQVALTGREHTAPWLLPGQSWARDIEHPTIGNSHFAR
jgi:DNA invertase Pin-like site-specific DNA recombinase